MFSAGLIYFELVPYMFIALLVPGVSVRAKLWFPLPSEGPGPGGYRTMKLTSRFSS